jgi:hypothetical protein
MAETKKKKSKRKKIKYFKYELKLSKQEKEKMDLYCKIKKTTPNKLMKNALRDYLKRFGDFKVAEPVGKNQMNIFDIIDKLPEQMNIFDVINLQPDM